MLKNRIIPCLDVKDGRVVKGINFVDLVDAGDPVEQAKILVCFFQPDKKIKPSFTSKDIAILFLNFSQAVFSKFLFSTAAVPIIT